MKLSILHTFLIISILSDNSTSAQESEVFSPVNPRKEIQTLFLKESLKIDGKLDEHSWGLVKDGNGFFRQFPNQGGNATFDTKVKVLYNAKNLYIGYFCPDSLGKKGIRVPDMQRDFGYNDYDLVGVALDPFNDKRNAIAFQTNPYGAQRDLLCTDDTFFDRDWDGFWKVRTTRTDSGWVAEMQIPWSTLRYPKGENQDWGIQFVRKARRLGEQSSWSPFPRAYTPYRMNYAGILKGISPPTPSVNLRVQPYITTNYFRNFENGKQVSDNFKPNVGGEIKWAITPQTVLEATFNTDFAQADVDRQVQNLTRFSVFFPERRQFFLENASLFNIGLESTIQPFFSRRIGLSNGIPLGIDAGIRLVSRTTKYNLGALMIRQRGLNNDMTDPLSANANFGVLRYTKNLGEQNRIGGMVTFRNDEGILNNSVTNSFTYSLDGFLRIKSSLSWNGVVSQSQNSDANNNGFMAISKFEFANNKGSWFWYQTLVSKNYNPTMGFVYATDIIQTNLGGYFTTRPKWKPKSIRQIDPGAYLNMYHRASDGKFQQAELELFPIYALFNTGSVVYFYVVPTWQNVDESFPIVGINIKPDNYFYTRYRFLYGSDLSKKLSYKFFNEFGKFYNGSLTTISYSVRYAPVPQIAATLQYQRNEFTNVGEKQELKVTHLLTPELRLALNPRLQLTTFYQYNSAADKEAWNVRFSWEFQPLSFLYLVYNSNNGQNFRNDTKRFDTYRNELSIMKLTYLKQF